MNPYKVLGIRPNASKDEIENAYKNIIENTRVDDYSDSPKEFTTEEKLSQINEAYFSLISEFKYKEIRGLIESEQFIAAETELNLIGDKNNAEWNYLKGFVMLKKGWIQAGINHLKTAAELNPTNKEYQETLAILARKINTIKSNYARAARANTSNGGDMCGGGGGGGDMCGGGGGNQGGGIDPNILQAFLGGAQNNGAAPPVNNPAQGNPLAGMMGGGGGGNPLQNMLMQSMLGGGGNGMNMCGNGGRGGMC